MFKLLILIATVSFVYYAGYLYGENKATVYYKEQELNSLREYKQRLEQAEIKASQISQEYLELSNEMGNITDTNNALVKRLHQYERDSRRAAKDTGCAVNCPACPAISSGMAERVTRIVERADKAAIYATQCHKWVTGLRVKDKPN